MSRTEFIQDLIKEKGLNGALIYHDLNRRYLSGFTGSTGYILLTSSQRIFFADFRYLEQSQYQCKGYEIISIVEYGLGHSFVLDIHESPRFSQNHQGDIVLKPKMIMTVEPGIYIPGWGGVRIEDNIIITEQGCINLTKSCKKLIEIT